MASKANPYKTHKSLILAETRVINLHLTLCICYCSEFLRGTVSEVVDLRHKPPDYRIYSRISRQFLAEF